MLTDTSLIPVIPQNADNLAFRLVDFTKDAIYGEAMSKAQTHKVRHKDGTTYWVERRVWFEGIQWNYGEGWRTSRVEAFRIARDHGSLNPVKEKE